MNPFEQLKVNDIFRFSYDDNDDNLLIGFGKVISIKGFEITCKDIYLDDGGDCEGEWSLKEGHGYTIIEIIMNRKDDLSMIKETHPEYFI